MGDRSLPPQVDGHPQGRLDLIFGRPVLFPPAKATQSFIFTFRWWGDIRPCLLRLPPEKSEARITYYVTCSSQSFRQYLCDSKSLHINIKIGGGENMEITEDDRTLFGRQIQSPRRIEGDTPRQKLLRRQLRLKKGWQDGDTIGTLILPDLKLNSRGEYVHEGRIIDTSADIIGTVIVTMVFMEGTLEAFQQIKIQREEQTFQHENNAHEKADENRSKHRMSGIPVLGSHGSKSLKTPPQEGYRPRSRSSSFRESLKQKCDRLKSPKKQQQSAIDIAAQEKENQAPQRKRAGSFSQLGRDVSVQHDKQQARRHDFLQVRHQGSPQFRQRENSHCGQQESSPGSRRESFQENRSESIQVNLEESFQENQTESFPWSQQSFQGTRLESFQVGHDQASQLRQQVHSEAGHQKNLQVGPHDSPRVGRRGIPQLTPQKNSQMIQQDSPQIVHRERKPQDGSYNRERPASWGLYPMLNRTDPHSLIDSGAVKAEDLPIFLQVLEGRSPNLDLSNLDPETQKLLDGLDLSMSFSGINIDPSGKSITHIRESGTESTSGKAKKPTYSVLKGIQKDSIDFSGVSMTSGVWPLQERKTEEKNRILDSITAIDKIPCHDNQKFDSPRRGQQGINVRTKIPMSQAGRTPTKACRTLSSRTVSEKKPPSPVKDSSANLNESEESLKTEKTIPSKYGLEDEGSVLVVDVRTLTLAPPLLPAKPPNKTENMSGVRVMHRSRVCYLTTLDINLPELDIPAELELSQTFASRQLVDHEIHYNAREVIRLPPASALDILRGQLVVRPQVQNGQDSLTRRQGKKNRKREEEYKEQSLAQLTLIAKLGLAVGKKDEDGICLNIPTKQMNMPSKIDSLHSNEPLTDRLCGKVHVISKSLGESLYSEKLAERENALRSLDSSSSSDLSDARYSISDIRQPVHHSQKPRIIVADDHETESSAFNSIYAPAHISPCEKALKGIWQHPMNQGRVDIVESILGTPLETKIVNSSDSGFHGYHASFLAGINGYESSNNQPIESGGESPCIRTASDFTADFVNYDTLNQRPGGIEVRREERGGTCRIHLEILKGRNLPLLEGPDGTPRPPNSYVRTTIGSINILTNVCQESDNPVWRFATDVLLPYSQLTQTDGSLILKVHHTPITQRTSVDDLLLGFVCVDATSIWSGHVSLCGWYPLLDLRGAARGHVKVSLTPHEPPQTITPTSHWFSVSLQEHANYYPPSSPSQSRHSYPQHTTHAGELYSDLQHLHARNDIRSSTLSSLGRSTSTASQLSPRTRRKNYSQTAHSVQDHTALEISSLSKQNLESSSYSSSPSVMCSGSVSDKHIGSNNSNSNSEVSHLYVGVTTTGDQTHHLNRKTSNIPVFSHGRNSLKMPSHDNDKPKSTSVLPDVVYKEQESLCPNVSVVNQGYSRHKGSIIVKGTTPESNEASHQMEKPLKDTSNFNSCKHPSERENGRMIKDSIIVSHFQMQKKKEQSKEDKGKEEIISSNTSLVSTIDSNKKATPSSASRDYLPSDNQPPMTISENKPSSCLKVPGSPSLRAKHVTFAHKLVHHQSNDTASAVHYSQDRANRRYQLTQLSRTPQASNHDSVLDSNIQSTMEKEASKGVVSRDQVSSHSMTLEESDLQVVPCREGDTQIVTTTVSVQGSKTLNAVSSYGNPSLRDKNKTDLIMAFSWMNQTSGCDSPCVSYIESKQQTMQHNQGSNGSCTSSSSGSSVDLRKAATDSHSVVSQKKSKKFRSRLAANFSLK
ncbi:C2 domain-containing protein 3-like [Homarus americanus]|uniref:C2 domain-containing protein 3-like n=1 Tax=Homarus americanus TaxID=6706 RepID=A0A8J5N0E9_HOMAM|nr:C2 domain-containing protein 3-like [Homarus americanus]